MMDTLSEVMQVLRERGYTTDFNLEQNCLVCSNGKYRLMHDEFSIDKTYRFEGETLYAISSDKYGIKGILVNGGGIYTDELADEILAALEIKRK
jgi:hypothetical protein